MKTGYLITARLKSSRLKRKIVLDIDGDTVLDKVIQRCKSVKNVDKVVLCTSTNSQDSELERYADKYSISFFKGSEDDVLKRLLDAANKFNINRFLSITADNPLHSIETAEQMLNFDSANNIDFIFTHNLPVGISPYFIKTQALDVTVYMKKDSDTEIWGPYVNQPTFFSIAHLNITNSPISEKIRLTCDYEEDYELIKTIHQLSKLKLPTIFDIENILKTKPKLFNINKLRTQHMLDRTILDNINNAFNTKVSDGLKYLTQNKFTIKPGLYKKDITI